MNLCSECQSRPIKYQRLRLCNACYERQRKAQNPEHERALARQRNARYRKAHGLERNARERQRRTSDLEHLTRRRAIERQSYRKRRLVLLEQAHQRKARGLDLFVAPVDWAAIHERDRGICQLCGHPVALAEMSLDHIVPMALNGTHEPSNVQTAHRNCNLSKNVYPQQQSEYYERLYHPHETMATE